MAVGAETHNNRKTRVCQRPNQRGPAEEAPDASLISKHPWLSSRAASGRRARLHERVHLRMMKGGRETMVTQTSYQVLRVSKLARSSCQRLTAPQTRPPRRTRPSQTRSSASRSLAATGRGPGQCRESRGLPRRRRTVWAAYAPRTVRCRLPAPAKPALVSCLMGRPSLVPWRSSGLR